MLKYQVSIKPTVRNKTEFTLIKEETQIISMIGKKAKDLKLGDYLYFFNTNAYSVSKSQVISIERGELDSLKVTWENDQNSQFVNYGYIGAEDDMFYPNGGEEFDSVIIYLNKEDVISYAEAEIDRLKKEIEDLL